MATLRTALLLAAAALLACCGSAFVVPSNAKASPAAMDRRCMTTGLLLMTSKRPLKPWNGD